ncbi:MULTISPECIES: heavy-metal-associated domain-containing protein [Nostocales]|uniref:Heavy metal transporter n=3 Tax=Nostocales TaxID=1161 RepID=A0A0C1QMR9_9CYAN|nr:heavy-metal-associated domain-containing protein [Tolypothrix bouteillei]KAF3889811.1 heavy-metal-associated domain-containing protein [Tolypothrix bouteillei VB521301]
MAFQLTIPKMACSVCADKITKAIQAIDPNATVLTDPRLKLVSIATKVSEFTVRQALVRIGYPAI